MQVIRQLCDIVSTIQTGYSQAHKDRIKRKPAQIHDHMISIQKGGVYLHIQNEGCGWFRFQPIGTPGSHL